MEFVNRRAAPFVHSGEKWKARTKSRSEMPVWTVSQRFSHPQWRRLFRRIMGQTNNDCRVWIFTLTSSPHQGAFASWKMRFKTEVCTCSQFPTEAMQWIKEVEMVDSVDDLRSSSSVRCISMPNFEVLDARIASAQNKIIHNSHFKRRISLEEQEAQKQDSFLRGRQIAYLIYDYFRVTGSRWFCRKLCRLFHNHCSTKWWYSGIRFKVGRNSIVYDENPTWWHLGRILYNLRIRESEKLKTVLELYDLEIHQKKLGPDYHRLKTMVKRSIEQNIRNKNFGIRNENFEKNAVVKNQGTKQRVQRVLGDCLAMGNQRAVCERRQLQFPPRYQ